MDEKVYIKAFNQGYRLKEHLPEFFDTLVSAIIDNSEYKQGLKAGGEQFVLDSSKLKEVAKFVGHKNYHINSNKKNKDVHYKDDHSLERD